MKSEIKRRAVQGDPKAQAEVWNARHPSGTEVNVKLDNGDIWPTKTRSEAWVLGDHTAVVMLEGRSGGYLLERVQPK